MSDGLSTRGVGDQVTITIDCYYFTDQSSCLFRESIPYLSTYTLHIRGHMLPTLGALIATVVGDTDTTTHNVQQLGTAPDEWYTAIPMNPNLPVGQYILTVATTTTGGASASEQFTVV